MKLQKKIIWIIAMTVLLLSSCGAAIETAEETDSRQDEIYFTAYSSADDAEQTEDDLPESPLLLKKGNIKLLARGNLNEWVKEVISRFNREHAEKIEVTTIPNDLGGEIIDASYYEAAKSGAYDIFMTNDTDLLRLLTAQGYLLPLDSLIGRQLEEGDYFQTVNAGRIGGDLYIFAPFFYLQGILASQDIDQHIVSSYRSIADYVFSLPDQSFWKDPRYIRYGTAFLSVLDTDDFIDFDKFDCHFGGAEWEAILEMWNAEQDESRNITGEEIEFPLGVGTPCFLWSYIKDGNIHLYPLPSQTHTGYPVSCSLGGFAASWSAENLGTIRDFFLFLLSPEIQRMELTAPSMNLYSVVMDSCLPLERGACKEVLTERYNDFRLAGRPVPPFESWLEAVMDAADRDNYYEISGFTAGLLGRAYWEVHDLPPEEQTYYINKTIREALCALKDESLEEG